MKAEANPTLTKIGSIFLFAFWIVIFEKILPVYIILFAAALLVFFGLVIWLKSYRLLKMHQLAYLLGLECSIPQKESLIIKFKKNYQI